MAEAFLRTGPAADGERPERALSIRGLRVTYPGPPAVQALDGIDLDLARGECVGILGESGSGKSTLAQALLGLLPTARVEGSVRLGDTELTSLDESGWRQVRWSHISLAFQSPNALNPVLRIGDQLSEPLRVHLDLRADAADAKVGELLESVSLGSWAANRYPRELSGGQRRLVLVAMALACDPDVMVLDEPTAGLDAVTRQHVLTLLQGTGPFGRRERTLLIVSHEPDALGAIADRVAVMYRGWLAEVGPVAPVLGHPRHPYTVAMLNARPTLATMKELRGIRGDPPRPTAVARGCPFVERCTQSVDACSAGRPPRLVPSGEDGARTVACGRGGLLSLLTARGLRKVYRMASGLFGSQHVVAVDDVSIDLSEGQVVGVVGPTGSGKSTVARLLVRLLDADAGTVRFEGEDLLAAEPRHVRLIRRRLQLLFQDPFEAMSPRMTVARAVREPLDVQHIGTRVERDTIVRDTLAQVRLPASAGFLERYAHELSGGQLQRVALARALVLGPKVLIADEPVTMLDPSEQTRMLQLLKSLQVERGMAMVFISHELAVVLHIADYLIVLDNGRIVEEGTGARILSSPQHTVTRRLLDASGRDELLGHSGGVDGESMAETHPSMRQTISEHRTAAGGSG